MEETLTNTGHYTFGHSLTAAERLRIIAGSFNPLAAQIISDYLHSDVLVAADMGCGPGYTTDMVSGATHAIQVIGIDISSYFIDLAKKNYPQYNFIIDDVTALKSTLKYDFMYCRFLLSHLQHVDLIINQWTKLLNPGGILFIDELEGIETDHPVFKKYLQTNYELIASQGSELYIGSMLKPDVKEYKILDVRSDIIPVADSLAAGWFYPNTISIWIEDQFVISRVPEKERVRISDELITISKRSDKRSTITWKMKRILITT
jgi:trans-aconitate 2-methyltransferase